MLEAAIKTKRRKLSYTLWDVSFVLRRDHSKTTTDILLHETRPPLSASAPPIAYTEMYTLRYPCDVIRQRTHHILMPSQVLVRH